MAASFDPSKYLSPSFNQRFIDSLKGASLTHPEVLEGIEGHHDKIASDRFYRLFRQDLDQVPSIDLLRSEEGDSFFPTPQEMLEALSGMSEGLTKSQVECFQELVFEVLPIASHQLRGRIILFFFHQWMLSQKAMMSQVVKNVDLMISQEVNPEAVVTYLKKEED